jgi:hypothetical protein
VTTKNGGTEWLVKGGAGAAAGAIIALLVGQFVPQVQGQADASARIGALERLVGQNTVAIDKLREELKIESRLTRTVIEGTIAAHEKDKAHDWAAEAIIRLESRLEQVERREPRRPSGDN